MSEPLAGGTTPSNSAPTFLLDGELPRLGGSTPATPAASTFAAPPAATPAALAPPPGGPSAMSSAPGSAPVLGVLEAPSLPMQPIVGNVTATPPVVETPAVTPADLPTLPTVTPTVHQAATGQAAAGQEETVGTAPTATDEHPMAHLMPAKSAPSEASRRAAELRAAKKAKARKIKIGVATGALVLAAIVGPPLGKWFVDAINESGSTSTDVEE